ncbi:copia protein [Tanacetum coccineum]|uniref:Copia protein n=1 Tax=Tanacetum coccineum TaxID=301880 RepID=A0ABQ4WSF3_9ASTR
MGMVDNTLFTKKKSSNLIIVQIYVEDIILGLTCQDICDEFAKIMHDEFEMSMMGELNFFLGLQIKQMEDGIFFNQSKYIKEMLKKFGLEESKPMKTPMSSDTKLMKDEVCESVDSTKYQGMIDAIGSWKKRPHDSNASSSSTTLNHPSSSRLLDDIVDENDEESRKKKGELRKSKRLKIDIGRFSFAMRIDDDYTIAITPVLPTKEPVNSLSMGDEHLDTIPATESDEVIKSSVENLVPIPSESEGIPDSVCDVPLCNNPTPLEAFKEHSETIIDSNNDSSLSDDDSYENIDYVDASPPDAEIVSLEVVEIVIPEVGGIDTDILLTIKDDILREKLLNVNLLIANIEALKDNPQLHLPMLYQNSSGSTTTRSDYSLPDYEAFYSDDDHIKEKSSGSTTTSSQFSQYRISFIFDISINPFPPTDRSDFYHEEFTDELAHIISPPEYDHFSFKNEPEMGDFTMDVVNDIFPTREPRVHVPNVFPPIPPLIWISYF